MSLWVSVQVEGLGSVQVWGKRRLEKGEERFLPLTPEGLVLVGEPWSGEVGISLFEVSPCQPGASELLLLTLPWLGFACFPG